METEYGFEGRQLTMWDYLGMVAAEQQEQPGEPSRRRIATTTDTINVMWNSKMLDHIVQENNLFAAAKKVKANKGAAGIDEMTVRDLYPWLATHYDELAEQILSGKFKPNPVRRVQIPKDKPGEFRNLGIPTVVDRCVQQAIATELTPIYEAQFSDNSFGFRPGRGCADALQRCLELANEGYTYVVSMDLRKYFDTVNHSKLIEVLGRTIKDGRVISLIHKYLNAGVLVDGCFARTEEGVPQGGPLSPLLGNVMLNELDKELERRGHKFVRYADDAIIFCRSQKAAERTLEHIIPFIENKLFLQVNREKTVVSEIQGIKYLGHGFYTRKGVYRLRVHPKSVAKMRLKLKELLRKGRGIGNKDRKLQVRQYMEGWINFFQAADMKSLMNEVEIWYRRRIRAIYWKQWKRVRTRYRKFRSLKIPEKFVHMMANCRKGPWRASMMLNRALTKDWIHKGQGWMSFVGYYSERHMKFEN